MVNWIKANSYGASTSSSLSGGGLFRNCRADYLGGFMENLGLHSSFFAELSGAICAIKVTYSKKWHNLWLETDSVLVALIFRSKALVPWQLRTLWWSSRIPSRKMNIFVTPIFSEVSGYVDLLAKEGLALLGYHYHSLMPPSLGSLFVANMLGMPKFRFTSFC
ncbi:unnamed protein product [Lathyrus oleraceus]